MVATIKEPQLAGGGQRKIEWAASRAPVLNRVRDRLQQAATMRGRRVGIILPLEPKTAYLAVMLAEVGAEVALACPGALVQDDVAAAVAARGVEVFARSDSTHEQERDYYAQVLKRRPEVIIDDRAELIRMAHSTNREALSDLRGASEETTSGVLAMRAMEHDGSLRIPCIAANDAKCKYLFDNRYGSGQSALQAVMDSTNLLLAGKLLLVVGYGWVGKGIARRARGLGARLIISEVDPVAALEAYHDGFTIAPVREACAVADIVITASGCRDSLPLDAIERLKDGALLANAGGIDDEFDMGRLRARALAERSVRPHVVEYRLGPDQSVFVIGDGKVVNLTAGEGHPVEIMDLTFGVQALAAAYLLEHAGEMKPGVHLLPAAIDDQVARMKLDALGVSIDRLTAEQERFLTSWEVPA
jgi:adenosylhomocysteinase